MSPVYLWDGEMVDSFHSFIFADEAARAPCIYGLRLPDPFAYGVGERDPRFRIISDRLAALLQAAVHLEYLNFPTTINLDPVLTAAANLTSLRELCVVFEVYVEDSWKLLTTFRSPLRSLRLDGGEGAYDSFFASLLHNHLANFAPTLEVLELDEFAFDLSASSVTTQFTAVRSLQIDSIPDFNGLEVLLRLFPNLDNSLVLGPLDTVDPENLYPTLRERSKEAQKAHAWSRLDRVVCDAKSAFLMALRCPIRRMDITVPRFHGKRYLAPTLRDNCPRLLHFRSPFNDGLDDLDGLFPSEGADNLTHLVMFADFKVRYGPQGKRRPIPWNQFRDKLIDSMKHLRLTHLRLVLHYTVHQATRHAFSERDSVNTAGEMDLYPAAARFVDAIPTLQCIFLTTCGYTYDNPTGHGWRVCARRTLNKWRSSKAWRAVDDHDGHHPSNAKVGTSCMELSRTAAERVMDQEELYLSRDEEDMVRKCSDPPTPRD